MALQVFCIPTEGDNDADLTTHPEVINHRAALLKCNTPSEITAYYKSIGSKLCERPKGFVFKPKSNSHK
jgi:hypothetical protein